MTLLTTATKQPRTILTDNRDKLEVMKDALMEYETIDTPQIDDIMEGRKPKPPKDWDQNGNSSSGGTEAKPEEAKPESDAPSADDADSSEDGDKPVGGPAGQH